MIPLHFNMQQTQVQLEQILEQMQAMQEQVLHRTSPELRAALEANRIAGSVDGSPLIPVRTDDRIRSTPAQACAAVTMLHHGYLHSDTIHWS